jgi:signal peptidase
MWVMKAGVALLLAGVIGLFLVPRLFGWELQVVLSGSMQPALPPGSVSLVQPIDAQGLEVGDLLVFELPRDPSQQVTHRIVEIRGDGSKSEFLTKGDANNAPDDYWVPAANIRGTVRGHIPYIGYIVPHVRTPVGYFLLVVLPAAIIIYGEVKSISVSAKRRKQRQEGYWS